MGLWETETDLSSAFNMFTVAGIITTGPGARLMRGGGPATPPSDDLRQPRYGKKKDPLVIILVVF